MALAARTFLSVEQPIPLFSEIKAAYQPSEAWLLDRNGEVIAVKRMNDKVRRLEWVSLNDISAATKELLVVSEDHRFYQHDGVDSQALLASIWSNLWHLFDGKRPRGASTLTMQLAGFIDSSLAPAGMRRTFPQKLKQVATAIEIEKHWNKQEILEVYLNLASFRGEIVGIQAASFALFGSHPSALNRAQSLLLTALLKGPMSNPEHVSNRACALLKASHHENDPTCKELHNLAKVALNMPGYHIPQDSIAPHLAQKMLDRSGIRLSTTVDANLQRFVIQSIREHLLSLDEQDVKDGAAIVIDNKTGDVLAYVGSSGNLSDAADVDGVSALRQAGSTLKPFMYGMAIDGRLLTAASVLEDSPIQLATPMGLYIPQNYDRDFKGAISVRTALASSLNVPAVRSLGLVGIDSFVRTLRTYGLGSLAEDGEYYGFSLALGSLDVRLAELTNAYRALANQGVWSPVRYKTTDTIKVHKVVLSKQAAFIISDILADKGARAMTFGLENPLGTRVWSAVKTGTSKDMRDNWCIGFTNRYTVGVWVGNFSGAPMKDVSGVSGAAPIWRDIIDYLHTGKNSPSPKPPLGVIAKELHFTPEIESPRTEWFIIGTESTEIRIATPGKSYQHSSSSILYPPDGTVIAMDPDIPVNNQRVQLYSRGKAEVIWLVDGVAVGKGSESWWVPSSGRHKLTLTDVPGNELDTVTIVVRGPISP